jgi:hypothetical protein
MSLRARLLAIASALTMFAGLGLVSTSSAGAIVTFNVANDHVTCNTLSGTIKFATHLKNSGPTTGSQTTTVTAALAGCVDDDNASVKMFKGAITASLASTGGSNCASLLGLSSQSASSPIVWTPGAGQGFIPKTTVGTVQKAATNVSFTQVRGGIDTVAQSAWNTSYGLFAIGSSVGTNPLAATVDFAGSDGWFAGSTQQDIGNILTACGSTAGLAALNFGNGAVHLGAGSSFPSSTTTCQANVSCSSPTVTSLDGSTSLQVTASPSPSGPQTLTLQVGGLSAMLCSLPGSGSVISKYHTTAADATKIAAYTVFGAAADFANNFYAAHNDISGCYGSPDPFNGWSPSWETGTYVYGPAPFDANTGLYEAFLGNCANHGGYTPCFVNINGGTYNTTEVHSPASANDPRISH